MSGTTDHAAPTPHDLEQLLERLIEAQESHAVRLEKINEGFRAEQQEREHQLARKTRRRNTLIVLALLLISLTVWDNRQTSDKFERQQRVDQMQQERQQVEALQRDWDQQVSANDACFRQLDGRLRQKGVLLNIVDVIARPIPGTPRSEEEQKVVDAVVAEIKAEIDEQLPLIDCDSEAPRPEGDRPEYRPEDDSAE